MQGLRLLRSRTQPRRLDSCYKVLVLRENPQKSASPESANLYETIGDDGARNKRARTVLMPLRSLKPVIYRDTESVDAVSRR